MRRLLPGVLALCLALTACSGGEDEPAPTLEPLASSATPSPTGAAVPSEAAAATPEGAAEFVRYFYGAILRGYSTGDASEVRALSAPSCDACGRFIDTIERLKSENARIGDGYTVEVVSVEAPGLEPGQETLSAAVILNISEFVRYDATGAVTVREEAVDGAVQNIDLRRVSDSWQVTEVSQA